MDVVEGDDGVFYADYRNAPIPNEQLLRLHSFPNVLITPHIAYHTDHALRDIVVNSVGNCVRFARGARRA